MYVCICKAVNDETVHQTIDDGADSLRLLCERTGAGSCCGRCVPELQAMLATRCVAWQPENTRAAACLTAAA